MLLLKREVTKKLNEVIGAGYVKEVGLTDKMFSAISKDEGIGLTWRTYFPRKK
jgi:hypothetical protein